MDSYAISLDLSPESEATTSSDPRSCVRARVRCASYQRRPVTNLEQDLTQTKTGLRIDIKWPCPTHMSLSHPLPLTVMNIRLFEHCVYPGVYDSETDSGSRSKDVGSSDLPRISPTRPSSPVALGPAYAQSQPSGIVYAGWAVVECIKLFFL